MTTRSSVLCAGAILVLAAASSRAAEPQRLEIPDGGFERGGEGWKIPNGEGMSTITDARAASGRRSLRIVDAHSKNGSSATSKRVAIPGAGAYELRCTYYPVSGSGLGVYVRIYDASGRHISRGDDPQRGVGGTDKKWRPFALPIYASEEARFLEVWFHSYSHARVEAYIDDLVFVKLPDEGVDPPWERQYKIKPRERDRLTSADVVGPDGIVYPNWRYTGVQGGIPYVKAATEIERHGARADDDRDDSAALQRAVDAVGKSGGGAVMLGAGTYYLDRPVTVRHDGVVIRGAGEDETKLMFRYAIHERGLHFYWPPSGSRVGPNTRLELHAVPRDLVKLTIKIGDRSLGTYTRGQHSGNTFSYTRWGRYATGKMPDGKCELTGIAEYRGGKKKTHSIPIELDRSYRDERFVPEPRAAICFKGRGYASKWVKLAQDGKRGSKRIVLQEDIGLRPGDRIMIDGPATTRWKDVTRNVCRWGNYRRYMVVVERTEGDGRVLRLMQPLRIEFPAIDGSRVCKIEAIARCGIENLYIEQIENLWITTVELRNAWNCWGKGVRVRMCGRNPIYGANAKWCEIRDCVFDDAHFKGGGGTAYAGWENSWDCLMEDCGTFKLRHAPLIQWSGSGNVIRKCVFVESDGQWHSGWTNENLFELCHIEAQQGNGSYGYGLWASPPEDAAHGPNGPRNVVYNCDIKSPKSGLWMGGMNENWLILHNRFDVGRGPGVFAKTMSFDHIIKGNAFLLRDGKSPMVFLATPDCSGVEILDNVVVGGSGKVLSGAAKPAELKGNRAARGDAVARPKPRVMSIYEWQQKNVR